MRKCGRINQRLKLECLEYADAADGMTAKINAAIRVMIGRPVIGYEIADRRVDSLSRLR